MSSNQPADNTQPIEKIPEIYKHLKYFIDDYNSNAVAYLAKNPDTDPVEYSERFIEILAESVNKQMALDIAKSIAYESAKMERKQCQQNEYEEPTNN